MGLIIVDLVITNGPQDTTVCMNTIAEVYCGFTGTSPNFAIPNWRIVFREVIMAVSLVMILLMEMTF